MKENVHFLKLFYVKNRRFAKFQRKVKIPSSTVTRKKKKKQKQHPKTWNYNTVQILSSHVKPLPLTLANNPRSVGLTESTG